jgi:hypothetical protein
MGVDTVLIEPPSVDRIGSIVVGAALPWAAPRMTPD